MMATSALEQTLRYDRLIVAIGIATVVAFSWGYLIAGAGIDMSMADSRWIRSRGRRPRHC